MKRSRKTVCGEFAVRLRNTESAVESVRLWHVEQNKDSERASGLTKWIDPLAVLHGSPYTYPTLSVGAAWLTRRPNAGWRLVGAEVDAARKQTGLVVPEASWAGLAR